MPLLVLLICPVSRWIPTKPSICPSFKQALSQFSLFLATRNPQGTRFTFKLKNLSHENVNHMI